MNSQSRNDFPDQVAHAKNSVVIPPGSMNGADVERTRNAHTRQGDRRLTVVVGLWLLAVLITAAVIVVRAHSPQPFSTAAATNTGATGSGPAATEGTPLRSRLYVDPNSQAASWVRGHQGSSTANRIEKSIADQPTGKWFGPWSGDIRSAVSTYVSDAAARGRTPVLVAYNLPHRDCGGQSAGGAASSQEYAQWIDDFAAGIDGRPAIVILEPDALAMLDKCLTPSQQHQRLVMLSQAVDTLHSKSVQVYLDAGHSGWVPADAMAQRLKAANIAKAHGFSLNVSNFDPTDAETAYAQQVNQALGMSKSVVIDTSRNGNGSAGGQWCNPAGRKLGQAPQQLAGKVKLLWVKAPGESDGNCGAATGTTAGQFSPQLAGQLIAGS